MIPDKCQWQNELNPDNKGVLAWYTDGTKTIEGSGADEWGAASFLGSTPWYSRLNMSFRLV